jgi:hypothetical protein
MFIGFDPLRSIGCGRDTLFGFLIDIDVSVGQRVDFDQSGGDRFEPTNDTDLGEPRPRITSREPQVRLADIESRA